MKRALLMLMVAAAACNSTDTSKKVNDNRLPTTLVSNPHTADGMDTVAAARKPIMVFSDTTHDFGAIHEGEVVQCEFAFSNTGKSPLIISSAQGSCGCTIPEYPHDPIAPGQGGVMKVSFNSAGKAGPQEKSVIIHTNSLRGIHNLYIKADVAKKK